MRPTALHRVGGSITRGHGAGHDVRRQVASAHAARVSADPADNTVLATGPERVSATFNERLQTTFVAMTVVGPDGNLWSAGEPTVAGPVASIGMRALGSGRHLHGELPGDLRRWPRGLRILVISAHGGRRRDARTRCRCHLRRRRDPGMAISLVAVTLIGAGCVWAVRRRP